MEYPNPEDIRPKSSRHSTALIVSEQSGGWNVGTAMIFALPAVIWSADSSGENFEKKMKAVKTLGREGFMDALLDGNFKALDV